MTMYLLSTVFRYYFNHRSKSTFWLTSTDLIDIISYKGSTIIVTIANLCFMKWSIPVHPHLGCFSGPQTVDDGLLSLDAFQIQEVRFLYVYCGKAAINQHTNHDCGVILHHPARGMPKVHKPRLGMVYCFG